VVAQNASRSATVVSGASGRGGVSDARPCGRAGAEPLGDPESDQALAEHVLHRLAEPEVDARLKAATSSARRSPSGC
jgi:hypothetical protein